MAGNIATISGIALVPGISRNRRLYTGKHVRSAVARAQARLAEGERPIVMLSAHPQGVAQSREVTASLTSMTLDEQGRARFTADIADTPAAWDIAKLADTSDGQPAHLKGVSIRGNWLGTVRKVGGPDGQPVETADDLEIDGLDFTPSPGVNGAGISTFAWITRQSQMETTQRVPITESVQEALVTGLTDNTSEQDPEPQVPATVREAVGLVLGETPHILENGLCVTCADVALIEAATPMGKRSKGIKGTGGPFADPGYQADGKQRYQLDTKAHTRSAWSYINQADNAKLYTANQLKRIKGRILAALKRFGVKTSKTATEAAAGWTFDSPVRLDESVMEWVSPDVEDRRSGSWGISASNGPVSLYLSSYCMDPGDLDVILAAAANAAGVALKLLDPDMDGDVDVPGVGDSSDPDDDAKTEAAPGQGSGTEATTDPSTDPASAPAAETQEGEPAMTADTTSETAGQAPAATAPSQAAINEAVTAALTQERADRKARKAAKRAKAQEATDSGQPASGTAPVAEAEETPEQHAARIKTLVTEGIKAAFKDQEEPAVEESEGEMIARLIKEGVDGMKQELVASGAVTPGRKGLTRTGGVDEHRGAEGLNPATGLPAEWGDKPLHEMSGEEFERRTAPVIVRHVLGDRADKIG